MSVGKILFKGIDSTSNIQEIKKEEVKPSTSPEESYHIIWMEKL